MPVDFHFDLRSNTHYVLTVTLIFLKEVSLVLSTGCKYLDKLQGNSNNKLSRSPLVVFGRPSLVSVT